MAQLLSSRRTDPSAASVYCYDGRRMMRQLRTSAGLGVLLLVLVAASSAADVVHLLNGRSIEGIVLEESADQVRIRLAFGEIGLPRSSILQIERGRSALAEFLERREALMTSGQSATTWLALARWADDHGLDHSCREATLRAAQLDPGLEGLRPLMQRFGYAFDQELAIWLPYEELMERRGYVRSGDRWLSPAQAVAHRQALEESARHRQEQLRHDRLARAMEMIALARIAEAEENRQRLDAVPRYPVGLPVYGGFPIFVRPGHGPRFPSRPRPPQAKPGHPPEVAPHDSRETHQGRIISRAPGSWIPVSPGPTRHGGVEKASGSNTPP
jgi:hypothetical protein